MSNFPIVYEHYTTQKHYSISNICSRKSDLFQIFSVELAAYSQTYLPEYNFLSKSLYIQITVYNT